MPTSPTHSPSRLPALQRGATLALGAWLGGVVARAVELHEYPGALLPIAAGAGMAWFLGGRLDRARATPPIFLFLPLTLLPGVPGWRTLVATAFLFPAAWIVDRRLDLDDPRTARRLLVGFLLLGMVGTSLLGLLGIGWLGQVQYGQDTGYQANLLWNTLHGDFLRSVVLQDLIHDPPLHNDFGAHNSPLQLLLLPVYAIWPSAATLILVRNLLLWLAPGLLFRQLAPEMGPRVALWGAVALGLQATFLWQSIVAFYFLQLCVPLLVLLAGAWQRQSLRGTVVLLLLLLGIREDLAVVAVGLAGVALVQRRRWPWMAVPGVLGLAWWVFSTRIVLPAGGAGAGGAVAATLEEAGGSPVGIVLGALRDPGAFLGLLFRAENVQMFLELGSSVGWIGLFSPLGVAALPFLGINALVDFAPAKEVFMHYHLLASVFLILGGVHLLARRAGDRRSAGFLVLGLACAVGVAGTRILPARQLAADLRPEHGEILRAVVEAVEDEASVGAPGAYLPALARRPRLYLSSRIWEYPAPPPEVVIWDPDPGRANPLPGDAERYLRWPEEVRLSGEYRLERELPGGVLLFRRSGGG